MRRAATIAAALFVLSAILTPGASASFGIAPGGPSIEALNAAGEPYTLAGGHPDRVEVSLGFNTAKAQVEGSEKEVADGNPKDVLIEFAPGFSGNPQAVPVCPRRAFEASAVGGQGSCPAESQVGVVTIAIFFESSEPEPLKAELYNVEPAPGELAELGFSVFGTSVFRMRVRPDDYGLTIEQNDLTQVLSAKMISVELWGVPADHQEGTTIPRTPFLTMPARCDAGPLGLTVRTRSWQEPDRWTGASGDTGSALTDCAGVPFAPRMSFSLGTPNADSPSGASVDLTIPQDTSAGGRGSSAVRRLDTALPEGLSISPGVARGLTLCTDAALALGSAEPAACPRSARVGTIELTAPQLSQALKGNVFLGQSRPGERFRLFLVAEGPGIAAKLTGTLHIDPGTGQITATLSELPEMSLERISLRFDGGPRALLVTPLGCGRLTTEGAFEPYGGAAAVRSTDVAAVDRSSEGGPCSAALPFSPYLTGGATSPRAGQGSELTLTLQRRSGEQLAGRFTEVLPRGLSAKVGSVQACPDAALSAAACSASSGIGSVTVEIGSGASTASLRGAAYLTGPYRRAPFGIALVVPARLGPFDLGTMVTRAALRIDSGSGRVSIATDSLPQAIEGIPIRFRTIGIDIDRPGFISTPTSCAPASVDADVRSAAGTTASLTIPFSVKGCDRLRFAPRLAMRLVGGSEMHRGGSPSLQIGIRSAKGGANLRYADIMLPGSLRRNPSGLGKICARQDAIDRRCSDSTLVGRARATTPLMSEPLTGEIHIVQPEGSGPPELWTSLDAKGLRFDVRSKLRVQGGHAHTRLTGLPDAPLSNFVMRLAGGPDGLFSLSADPCATSDRSWLATAGLEGQNHAYRIERKAIGRLGCPAPPSRGSARSSGRTEVRGV